MCYVPGNGAIHAARRNNQGEQKNRSHTASWVCQRKWALAVWWPGTGRCCVTYNRGDGLPKNAIGIKERGPFPRRKQDSGLFHISKVIQLPNDRPSKLTASQSYPQEMKAVVFGTRTSDVRFRGGEGTLARMDRTGFLVFLLGAPLARDAALKLANLGRPSVTAGAL